MSEKISQLEYSEQARQRVVVGLRWDPQRLPFYLRWITPSGKQGYDLDLTCYIFNNYGDFSGIVSGEDLVHEDGSGAIYHSGDDKTGEFGHNDEEISIELVNLPEDVAHIVFIVTCKSAHSFDDVKNPNVRLTDAKTQRDQIKTDLDKDGADHNAHVFVRLFKEGTTWMVEEVNEYLDQSKIDNWPVYLQEKWSLA